MVNISHVEANLKGRTQTQYYYCYIYGHMASSCPIKSQDSKKGGWEQKKPALSHMATFVPPGLKSSVQYSTGVKYASWDVPTAITSVTDQAVVVTTQPNTAPVYPGINIPSVTDVKPILSPESSDFINGVFFSDFETFGIQKFEDIKLKRSGNYASLGI